jgi:hypothetical protein
MVIVEVDFEHTAICSPVFQIEGRQRSAELFMQSSEDDSRTANIRQACTGVQGNDRTWRAGTGPVLEGGTDAIAKRCAI